MNHAMIAAALPLLVCAVLYARAGCRASRRLLIGGPLVMAACALWAVVPDIPRMLGMMELYGELHTPPKANLFFFHAQIDRAESDSAWYALGFLAMGGAVLAVAWRELAARERGE